MNKACCEPCIKAQNLNAILHVNLLNDNNIHPVATYLYACTYCIKMLLSIEIMLAKLEQAKANNETLKVSYTTVLFSGSSGVGKTTLLNKLNKENLNRHHHSTGLAESQHAICIKTTALVESIEGLQWTNLDYDTMIKYLHKYLYNLKFPVSNLTVASLPPEENISSTDSGKIIHNSQFPLPSSTTSSLPKDNMGTTKNREIEVKIAKPDLVKVDIAKADSSRTPSLGDVWDIINFLDTGGQPEFVNILPAISNSIALTFIVLNLSKDLDSLVHVQHSINGNLSFEPYDLDCTNLEFIKHLLVSSENFDRHTTPVLGLKSIQRENSQNDSKICYVGTHALNVSETKIQEIDDKLSTIASEFDLHQRSFWSSPKEPLKRLFPIDMFPKDKEKEKEFESIIKHIHDNIQKQVQRRNYNEVPILWFIFLLKLQKLCNMKEVSYISYQEAVDVWMEENVKSKAKLPQGLLKDQHENISRDKSDVHNILLFFHFMGMLFYYHKVEGLRDYVFIDRQWLFKKLTELVELKFTKGYNKKDISAEDVDQFIMEGRLNINIIKNLKINLQGIQPLYFIHLLDHLNIVAPIDLKLNDFFMPCVLPSFPAQKLTELDKFYGTIQHVPLLVGFRNSPMHHGYFCHLIVELFRNLPTGWDSPLRSTSRMQHVYNNLITFPTFSGHAISLFYKIGYLEIQVRHKQNQSTIIHCNIRYELEKTLRKVSDHLQLNKQELCFGFYCNCERIQHFAKLKELTSLSKYIRCGYSYTEVTKDHTVWLQV